jgi:DNA-binding transcriptional ArsR family regulator
MREAQQLARTFKVLSVDTRVRIVQLLRGRTLCVGALSARLDVTQSAVSQHLRVLRDADLVIAEKRGYYVHYRLNERTLAKWRTAIAPFLSSKSEGADSCDPGSKKGRRQIMCDGKSECQRPKELVDRPEECFTERVKEYHGNVKRHPFLPLGKKAR